MNIHRTYPQPDSPRPNLGPRERAMAVFKYLLDLEPGEAIAHPRFAVIVHAFEQSGRQGWNALFQFLRASKEEGKRETYGEKALDPSYCDELSGTTDVGPARTRLFGEEAEQRGAAGL
jgi:hypothetical protein